VRNIPSQSWTAGPLLIGLVAWFSLFLCGLPCGAQSYPPTRAQRTPLRNARPFEKEGFWASIKDGFHGLAESLTLKTRVKPTDDPVKLSTKSKPTAEFHVAVARLYEQSDQFTLAANQYERALRLSPGDLAALLGYARLQDRLNAPGKAAELYNRATAIHPNKPAVFNNLGLYYAGRRMPDDAVAAFQRAIQLEPGNPKYRNNLARVFVEQGRNAQAFRQLRAVYSQAVAYYNLGFLLEQHGKLKFAAHHYAAALRYDPAFVHAKRGFARVEHSLADLPPPGNASCPTFHKNAEPVGLAVMKSRPSPPQPGPASPARVPFEPRTASTRPPVARFSRPPVEGTGLLRTVGYSEVEWPEPPQIPQPPWGSHHGPPSPGYDGRQSPNP